MLKDQTYKATKTGQRTLYISGSQVSDYIAHGWTVQGTGITPANTIINNPVNAGLPTAGIDTPGTGASSSTGSDNTIYFIAGAAILLFLLVK